MEEKLNKNTIKLFVLVTKYLPIVIALIHFVNMTISYFYGNDIPLNYIGGVSLLPVLYLYFASYSFKLCEYHRMFLHYIVIVDVINIIDYYVGIPITDTSLYLIILLITIIMMFIILYLKFF